MSGEATWRIIAVKDIPLAIDLILLDLFIPTLLVIGLCAISMIVLRAL
jgi:hypothetical protein